MKHWYSRRFITYLLLPLSFIFRLLVALRRQAFSSGLKKSTRISVPVIVVGNITVGGTGKTPFVAWLVDYLQKRGYQPGIISRGYGSAPGHRPFLVKPGSLAQEVGDEPLLLAEKTRCPVVIDPNRVSAAQYLLKQFPNCDVLVSDDGLQHYALSRDIEIALIDGERGFGNGHSLPAGPLREHPTRLRDVDFIVGQGEGALKFAKHVQIMKLVPDVLVNLKDPTKQMTLSEAQTYHWKAIAGIGNPERFFNQLKSLGLTLESQAFRDHHRFQASDLKIPKDMQLVMTEKDAVKCRGFANASCWYLPVTAQLSESFKLELERRLLTFSSKPR